ncbi:MAG TPA: hypothetical protein VH000_11235 [Rhizomicrobium sp.]|jgi:hypothetical protein|nr:hypothetical protein [Rhizomicrobium sp.]HEX4534795.1 hypothetical protein [Rhizomicrobium sp.]
MITITTVLLVIAFALFLLAAIGVNVGKLNLIAAGLAVWVLSQFIGVL